MILQGDCLEKMAELEANSIDTIITDPPYGLSFMGKKWDYDVPSIDVWKECLRVLKPGGTALIFAGSRTQHRMAVNVEDAGFELKDCIMWLYGSGFPKATDISKQLDKGRGVSKFGEIRDYLREKWIESGKTQKHLKCAMGDITTGGGRISHYMGNEQPQVPSWSDWCVLKKELNLSDKYDKLIQENEREVIGKKVSGGADAWNNGLKNKEGEDLYTGQKEHDITEPATKEAKLWNGWKSHGLKPAYEPILVAVKPNDGTYANNALKWGVSGLNIDGGRIETKENLNGGAYSDGEVTGLYELGHKRLPNKYEQPQGRFPANILLDEEAAKMLDEQSGENCGAFAPVKQKNRPNNVYGKFDTFGDNGKTFRNDKGGASRFFYVAKASKSERNAGCEELGEKPTASSEFRPNHTEKAKRGEDGNPYGRWTPTTNNHPTVKPLKLMEYLCTLTKTPTGGCVLDPFAGSGTTGLACINTGRDYILIEREEEYIPIIEARLKSVKQQKLL